MRDYTELYERLCLLQKEKRIIQTEPGTDYVL